LEYGVGIKITPLNANEESTITEQASCQEKIGALPR